ncbi:winged helix-turn-helix transcriptional regulator [Actinomycetospora soli]|uniref:winged helix-turn-helix transcriptional regulator n=1 Tax=Actinomycetospora soli TaxID=2893887 RepID=UPI001E4D633D|nr:helix-turn-helix domain-containing protein [Actinomycetospora soli]MCD2188389.1 helix-turn-helix transcriptional regulator [Actinomycetospora soli]
MEGGDHRCCAVAKAVELLDERWTMLVVRELVAGRRHFNELRRGLPGCSPSLLSKRLHHLRRAGVVERRTDGAEVRYELTPAGEDLRAVVDALGAWGARWAHDADCRGPCASVARVGGGQPPSAGC